MLISACAQLRFLAARLRILMPLILVPAFALAGGPKYIAGTSFFNPAVVGQPIHWSGGQVSCFVDQCPLSAIVSNQQATAMVDASGPLSPSLQLPSLARDSSPITLRVLDVDGNPMAGGSVSLYRALYAWTPPCAVHAVCPPSNLLATQTASATSALDGTVSVAAASLPGIATSLRALAASGNSSAINITVKQHP